ncbi:MAG: phenylalanine--tRNA ligase subunit alpha [Candidatus Hadarchaeales archaeon]
MKTAELGANEKLVLASLSEEKISLIQDVIRRTGLNQATVMRAALELKERGLIEIIEERREKVKLTEEGMKYLTAGLPERRLLQALEKREGPIEEIRELAGMNEQEMNIALAWCRRKNWIEMPEIDGKRILRLTPEGRSALLTKSPEEEALEAIGRGEILKPEMKEIVVILERRGLVEVEEEIERKLKILPAGEEIIKTGVEIGEEISELTKEIIVTGRWKTAKLKKYNVLAPVADIFPAKIHPQQRVIEEIRRILLGMGFVEIKARIVESEFWNFDALFQPQDHPARDIHDSLWVKKPEKTMLPSEELVRRVAKSHEKGVAGSRGWGYKFNPEISRRPVLCSQTTAATVRYLASKPKPPVKVFCIDRVYRHEKIDYKHLAEFYQCEGIVMERGMNLRNMLGYLKEILNALGFEKIKFMPSYFPYTEPSVQALVYHEPKGEWLEVLGAGMFRPELLRPLGIRYPVLAWGIGLSRLIMLKIGLEDIRDLFKNDLAWLRSGALYQALSEGD